MRLKSILLENVGRFVGKIALEPIGPGLNVLAAPNEAGKSTVFRALELLFAAPYHHKNNKIALLRPYTGGAPTITCAFDIDGETWSLKKRFLTSPRARLAAEASKAVFEDKDVQPQLDRLLSGATNRSAFRSMLWIGQTRSFEWPELEGEAHTSLSALLAREAEAAAGGQALADVEAGLRKDLEQYVTEKTGRPKARGPLAMAQAAVRDAQDAAEEAADACHRAQTRLAEQDRLQTLIRELRDPTTVEKRAQAIAECQAKLTAWAEAEQAFKTAEAENKSQESALRLAREHLATVRDGLRAVQAAAVIKQQMTKLAETRQSQNAAHEGARQEAAAASRNAKAAQVRLGCVQAHAKRAEFEQREAEVADRRAQAEAAFETVAEARTQLETNAATNALFERVAKLRGEHGLVTAQLDSIATRITVNYEAGAAASFKIAGTPLEEGSTQTLTEPVTLEVPGIGQITIAPGRDTASADLAGRKAHLADAIDRELAEAGASDFDDLIARNNARREAETAMREAEARLQALAPEGLGALRTASAQLEQQRRAAERQAQEIAAEARQNGWLDDDDAVHGDLEALLKASEQMARAAAAADEAVRVSEAALRETETQLKHQTALRDEENKRRAAAAERLGLERDVTAEDVAAANAGLATATEAASVAATTLQHLRQALPDPRQRTEILERKAQLSQAHETHAQRLRDSETQAKVLEGQIRRDRQDGVIHQSAQAKALLEQRQGHLDELQRHVEALQLLLAEIRSERAKAMSVAVAPTARRLRELAEPVFGAHALQLDSLGAPPRRQQHGASSDEANEDFASLSDGTREQIAVLARLAFARVLADQGAALPVILDDALVFSDDGRLAAMFEVLASAAQHHQVIVLSCQETRIGALAHEFGANRLALRPPLAEPAIDQLSAQARV